MNVGVTTIGVAQQTYNGTRTYFNDNYDNESSTATGILAGPDLFSTPAFDVVVGTPFSVRVQMELRAGTNTNITHGNANATASLVEFHFPIDTPVFDLPEGYTVDAPTAGIDDNEYLPEPSHPAMLAAGASLLALLSRRRARGAR